MSFEDLISNEDGQHGVIQSEYLSKGTEYHTREFNNNNYEISHCVGDLYEPKQIMCYDCSNNFSIDSIKLCVNERNFITIDDTHVLNNIVKFIDDVIIDGNICKTYYLDKTKLFHEIIFMSFSVYSIKITTTGNSNKIKLNGIYTYVSSKLRKDNVAKPHEYKIKRLCMGSVKDYYSMQTIYLDMMGHINGFILTKINPNMINKIYLRFDNRIRLHYIDKYEIMLNTIRINDDTLYINLNDNSYMADVNENSLNTSFFYGFINLSIGLDEEYQNNPGGINFSIVSYSNNIINNSKGICSLIYNYSNNINIKKSHPKQTP
jgi:hypothetical protein